MQSRMYLFFCENDIKVDLFIIAQKIVLFFNSYDNDLSLTRITFWRQYEKAKCILKSVVWSYLRNRWQLHVLKWVK